MRTILLAVVLTVGAGACSKAEKADKAQAEKKSNVALVTVDEVDQQIAKGDCTPVDANGQKTREKMGTLPGAVLLTDSEQYGMSELPTDKSKALVFYCANTQCGASHEAAERAITAGYTNVKVMPDGIAGWVKAGKKVQTL